MKYLYYKVYHTPNGESILSNIDGKKWRELVKTHRLEDVRGDQTLYDRSSKSIAFKTQA